MLAKDGMESFSMRKLASSLGVSHTAAYRHFSDKNALISAISAYCSRELYKALEDSIKNIEDPQKRLYELGVEYVLFFTKNSERLALFNIHASIHNHNDTDPDGKDFIDSFALFKNIAASFPPKEEYTSLSNLEIFLGFLSKVHGLASLLTTHCHLLPKMSETQFETMVRNILQCSF